MKYFLTILFASTLFSMTPSFAEEVTTSTEATPPTGEVLFSHHGDDADGGWGWYNLPAVYRHVGQSFRVPADVELSKITLLVKRMKGGTIQEQPYTLSLIELESSSQKPSDGRVAATFDGLMTLNEDQNFYLTFTLPSAVSLRYDRSYFIALEWRNPLPSNHLEMGILKGYGAGFIWESTEKTADEYQRIPDSAFPALIFFLQ